MMSQATQILELLEYVRERKEMYFSPIDGKAVADTLYGFKLGCLACGVENPHLVRDKVIEERGWALNALGLENQFREQGMSESQIADEILVIEIETWRRVAAKPTLDK
jgi:hypothetical protein